MSRVPFTVAARTLPVTSRLVLLVVLIHTLSLSLLDGAEVEKYMPALSDVASLAVPLALPDAHPTKPVEPLLP
ncbi:hypothetical protein CB604_19650 [Salmonella enterica subsp. enterica serovar Enteritidis]|uniref:Uncharacterized protein n=1 Tax=Salmonella enteritidis TaxID=149539 RepID=A0A635M7G8_SALEN|nr:hypothetical protein [Salmonella enterica subsp. enterica serovar Oranienburg]EDH7764690.1 hypothetical protein [Salmonella enterica subsp. enterica serovar Enteritidis]